jgi:hypothetical protein
MAKTKEENCAITCGLLCVFLIVVGGLVVGFKWGVENIRARKTIDNQYEHVYCNYQFFVEWNDYASATTYNEIQMRNVTVCRNESLSSCLLSTGSVHFPYPGKYFSSEAECESWKKDLPLPTKTNNQQTIQSCYCTSLGAGMSPVCYTKGPSLGSPVFDLIAMSLVVLIILGMAWMFCIKDRVHYNEPLAHSSGGEA